MLIQMQGMFAEYERAKIMETRRGRRHAAHQGSVGVFGCAPYGYHYHPKSTTNSKAYWEVEPKDSQVVRQMYDLVATRGYSLAAVCRELKSQGIRTCKGT